ncbi:FliM/FliN family flagellar motor switch protein [Roseicyclus marinus]|uniref:FliM/FliN family flagellar motor switch protein n=1 Tax=Roseicyclus marinus TaxID=2161673 RepID=UPI00240EDAF5|nr:FliM/FliN family flagellar motor switch protein [Roseicyclus marinus]MDG3042354.1 FliM/FliN family flagellar motor switch protein [Roseicyclus marinus]
MTFPVDPTVLRRKIAAHRRPPAARPDPAPLAARGLGRALRHAATPFDGLGLVPGDAALGAPCDLDACLSALPERGLLAVIEDAAGLRGLIALGHGLIDALVEVQTTGRIESVEMSPRPVTRIDEALARDFVDLALAALGRELAGIPGRDWPARFSYASRIRDRGQVALLLPEGDYRLLSATVGFDGVTRRAPLVLVLPLDPTAMGASRPDGAQISPDPSWLAARTRMVEALELPLEAVLLRLRRPLAEVQGLAVGDLMRFDAADLHSVTLEAPGGRALATGRLGQKGGRRAICLAARDAAGAGATPRPEPAPPPGLAVQSAPTPPMPPLPTLPPDPAPP